MASLNRCSVAPYTLGRGGVHRLGPQIGAPKPRVPNYRWCTVVPRNSIVNMVKSPVSALRTQWRFFAFSPPNLTNFTYRIVSLFCLYSQDRTSKHRPAKRLKMETNVVLLWTSRVSAPAVCINFTRGSLSRVGRNIRDTLDGGRSAAATDRRTNEQTSRQTDGYRHRVKPPLYGGGLTL